MKIVFAVLGIVLMCAVSAILPSLMWYCFDDKLAEITGVPSLGTIPFGNVFAFTLFMAWLFNGASSSSSKE